MITHHPLVTGAGAVSFVFIVPMSCCFHLGNLNGVDLRAEPVCVLVLAQIVHRWAPKIAIRLSQGHGKGLSLPVNVRSSRHVIVIWRTHTWTPMAFVIEDTVHCKMGKTAICVSYISTTSQEKRLSTAHVQLALLTGEKCHVLP